MKRFTLNVPEDLHAESIVAMQREGYRSLAELFLAAVREHIGQQVSGNTENATPITQEQQIQRDTEEIGRINEKLGKKRILLEKIRKRIMTSEELEGNFQIDALEGRFWKEIVKGWGGLKDEDENFHAITRLELHSYCKAIELRWKIYRLQEKQQQSKGIQTNDRSSEGEPSENSSPAKSRPPAHTPREEPLQI